MNKGSTFGSSSGFITCASCDSNEYVETINNNCKTMLEELKSAYEKMPAIKDEEITFLRSLLEKK
ncbi:MAG: hypothetical protein FWF54_10975 [Candidatus Azobacteroides sp.]|nr:hypothetical protein [Candidatus Azobacteroides sp.]